MVSFKMRMINEYPKIIESIKSSAERRGFSTQSASSVKGHILCELCECYLEWFKGGTSDRFWEELADVVIACISAQEWGQSTNAYHVGYPGFLTDWIAQASQGEYRFIMDRITLWAHNKDLTDRLLINVIEKVVKNELR